MKRLIGARLFAGAAVIFWGYFFFGLTDLLSPFIEGPAFYDSSLLSTGWGLLYTVQLAVPLVALVIRPRSTGPAAQLLTGSAAVAVPALWLPEIRQFLPAAGLLV